MVAAAPLLPWLPSKLLLVPSYRPLLRNPLAVEILLVELFTASVEALAGLVLLVVQVAFAARTAITIARYVPILRFVMF